MVILATGEQARYQEALDRLTDQGIDWLYVQGSVDSAQSREKLVCETVKPLRPNRHSCQQRRCRPQERRDLLEMTEESFDRVMNINAKANLFLTQLVARQMIARNKSLPTKGILSMWDPARRKFPPLPAGNTAFPRRRSGC